MIDPRLEIIGRRLEKVRGIIAVSSGKGGVGKSVVASTLALSLKKKGYKMGLLDLDFTSPSTHVILGVEGLFPEEEYGIIPPLAHGIRYMSITFYALDKPTPLRGADVSDAIIELLAITRWGELDYLIIDMPPGISDATFDIIRLMRGTKFLLVTTQSSLAFETVKKLIGLLQELEIPFVGIVENMVMKPSSSIRHQMDLLSCPYLGTINFDSELEEAFGDIERLMETRFVKDLTRVMLEIERRL